MTIATNLVGINFSRRTDSAEFKVGTAVIDTSNRTWVYCGADIAIPAATTAAVLSAAFRLTATTTGAYTADAAFAANEFGWVRKTTSPL